METIKTTIQKIFKPLKAKNNKNKQKALRWLDAVIFSAIFLIFFLTPIFFTGQTAQGAGFEKTALFYFLTLLGVTAWIIKGATEGELKIKRTPLDWPFIILLAVFVVSSFLSISQRDSFLGAYGSPAKGFIALAVFVLFFYLAISNLNAKRIKILFWALAASAGLLAAYALLQLNGVFILPLEFTRFVNFNAFGSLTDLSILLAVSLPLLAAAAAQFGEIHSKFKNNIGRTAIKTLAILAALGALLVLAILEGFVFWPAAITGSAVMLLFLLARLVKISGKNLVIPAAVFVLLVVLLVAGTLDIARPALPTEISLSRGVSWDIAKAAFKNNPLLGSGPSTFYYDFASLRPADFNYSPLWDTTFNNAAGAQFEILATVGGLGVLAAMILALANLAVSFAALTKVGEGENKPIALALFASLISLLIFAALFTFSSSLILVAALFFTLAAAVSLSLSSENSRFLVLPLRSSPKYALVSAAGFLATAAAVIVLLILGAKAYLADTHALKAAVISDTTQKTEELNKAVGLAPYRDAYYFSLAQSFMAAVNEKARQGKPASEFLNDLNSALSAGKKGLAINPDKADNNESLALIYENASFYTKGALELAEDLYEKVMELDPASPAPYTRLALINVARSNEAKDEKEKREYLETALKKYDEALTKKTDLAVAFYGKAVVYEKMNNIAEAVKQLEQTVALAPNDTEYRFELGRLYFNRGVAQESIAPKETEGAAEDEGGEELSVEQRAVANVISRNDDLNKAEQIFLSVLSLAPRHANSLYSLALLYQKTGETDKAKIAVKSLLDVLQDEQTKSAVKQQFPGLY